MMSASTVTSDAVMVDENPLVSVVVIFLDEERYLGEAVESVLAQTYDAWELLLVDDGSTDGSTELARAYADREPGRVRYLEHPGHRNLGMSASRNLGLREARGQYIAFLDADDALYAAALEEQVSLIEAHPTAAMAYGPSEWWYSWTGDSTDADRDALQPIGVEPNQLIHPPTLISTILNSEGTNPTGPLYRREAILAMGGFEHQFRGMYEDQVVRVKLCLQYPAYVSSRCWYRYRQHADGCCARAVKHLRHQQARAVFLRWVGTYLDAQRVDSPEVRRAHRRALWQCRYLRLLETLQPILAALALGLRKVGPSVRRASYVPSDAR
jgi:glycosyltransferase involved in cell wall biosynthesis